MAIIKLPFTLREKQTVYAAKEMANFNAIINNLNSLHAAGIIGPTDVQGVLTALAEAIQAKVSANESNADKILINKGSELISLQEVYDSGELQGADAVNVNLNNYAYFNVDERGHLIVYASKNTDFYIDTNDGHLYCEVPEAEEVEEYTPRDLGYIRGPAGEVTEAAMNDAIAAAISGIGKIIPCTAHAISWDNSQCLIECEGMNAACIFFVQPAASATSVQRELFRNLSPYIVSQTTDEFILGADGVVPGGDIPLEVLILGVI